jgi:tetratricopeptide (TPR) repeat protein
MSYRIAHLDEIDVIDDGRAPFRPIRHHLGVSSVGANAFTGRNAGDRIINEHDEEGEHEELYLVHQGRARFELDGEQVMAPAGTLVFARPGVTRTAIAEEPETTLIVFGGQPGEAYEVHGWEIWAPMQALYEAGQYAEAADRGRPLIEAEPQYPGALYNLACCESLAGRPADAMAHLRMAIEGSNRYRAFAAEDSDFDPIRSEPGFGELVGAGG